MSDAAPITQNPVILICGCDAAATHNVAAWLSRDGDTAGAATREASLPSVTILDVADDAHLAHLVVDAATRATAAVIVTGVRGMSVRDRRVLSILAAIGVRTVVIAVAVTDAMKFSASAFAPIAAECHLLAEKLLVPKLTAVPVSAATGTQVASRGADLAWFRGPTVGECITTAALDHKPGPRPFRLPVESVVRSATAVTVAGTIAAGTLRAGARVCVLPGGAEAAISTFETGAGTMPEAGAGQFVGLGLSGPVDVERGSVIVDLHDRPEVADQLAADVIWFDAHHLLKGRLYDVRLGAQTAVAQITDIRYIINVETLEHAAGRAVEINDIARCHVSLSKPLVLEPYQTSPELGRFELLERSNGQVVGTGLIAHSLRRAQNIHWQAIEVTSVQRAALKAQQPCCLWLTGLSGSGKSTIASLLEKRLHALGRHTYVLDGDNVRHGLNRDLGFTEADRVENIRRVAEVARLMVDAGLITIVSFISPFRSERQLARERFAGQQFVEVFVDAPLAVCEHRDPKGLYRKARSGTLQNFTGISSPYEPPERPDLRLDTSAASAELLVETILDALISRGVIRQL